MLDSVEGKGEDEGDGDARDVHENRSACGVGLHFVKLRPEPVTGENMRSVVQVQLIIRSISSEKLFSICERDAEITEQRASGDKQHAYDSCPTHTSGNCVEVE